MVDSVSRFKAVFAIFYSIKATQPLLERTDWLYERGNEILFSHFFFYNYTIQLCKIMDYNYRMAKTSERLNAIHNYMKKVKSNISMVFGLVS